MPSVSRPGLPEHGQRKSVDVRVDDLVVPTLIDGRSRAVRAIDLAHSVDHVPYLSWINSAPRTSRYSRIVLSQCQLLSRYPTFAMSAPGQEADVQVSRRKAVIHRRPAADGDASEVLLPSIPSRYRGSQERITV